MVSTLKCKSHFNENHNKYKNHSNKQKNNTT